MLVGRLEDRLLAPEVAKVLGEDVEVVAVGVQRSDPALSTLLAVVAVVVVGAETGHPFVTKDANETARDCGLAAAGVADDDDRPKRKVRGKR